MNEYDEAIGELKEHIENLEDQKKYYKNNIKERCGEVDKRKAIIQQAIDQLSNSKE